MRTEGIVTLAFRIYDAPRLDPITVIIEDNAGSGSITLTCYGVAWTAYFGACGNISEFIVQCNAPYLEGKMSRPKATKADREYLTRIIVAVQEAIKSFPQN